MTTAVAETLIDTPAVCKALGCSPHRLRRAVNRLERDGRLSVWRAGRNRLYRGEDMPKIAAELRRTERTQTHAE